MDRNLFIGANDPSLGVALLAEGVDRNYTMLMIVLRIKVALLAEGVDRNISAAYDIKSGIGRPPRGGRG